MKATTDRQGALQNPEAFFPDLSFSQTVSRNSLGEARKSYCKPYSLQPGKSAKFGLGFPFLFCRSRKAVFNQARAVSGPSPVLSHEAPWQARAACVLCSGFGVLGFGFWVLRFGFCVLGFVFCVLRFGFCILSFAFCVLGVRFCALCFGFCVLGFGFCVLGFGPERPLAGPWTGRCVADLGFWKAHSAPGTGGPFGRPRNP